MRENGPQKSTLNEDFMVDQNIPLTGHRGYTLNHHCVNILYPKRRLRYQKRPYYRYQLRHSNFGFQNGAKMLSASIFFWGVNMNLGLEFTSF